MAILSGLGSRTAVSVDLHITEGAQPSGILTLTSSTGTAVQLTLDYAEMVRLCSANDKGQFTVKREKAYKPDSSLLDEIVGTLTGSGRHG